MASTFSTQKVALDEIATSIQNSRQKLTQVKTSSAAVDAELGGLATKYTPIINDIDAALAADPNNVAVQVMHAEKGKLVAEFQSLKAAAASMKAATTAVSY
jgi:hypothetical protein